MSHETKSIKLNMLEINTDNPRFEMAENQRDAIKIMIESQQNKLASLAQDIIKNGLNPSDLIIVTPHEERKEKYKKRSDPFSFLGFRRLTRYAE